MLRISSGRGWKRSDTLSAPLFGKHPPVGLLEGGGRVAAGGKLGDAGGDRERWAVVNWMLESLADRRHPRSGAYLVHPWSNHQKLVAAPTNDVVLGTELLDDEIGEPLQSGVSDPVAKKIVDLLEIINVDEDEGAAGGKVALKWHMPRAPSIAHCLRRPQVGHMARLRLERAMGLEPTTFSLGS